MNAHCRSTSTPITASTARLSGMLPAAVSAVPIEKKEGLAPPYTLQNKFEEYTPLPEARTTHGFASLVYTLYIWNLILAKQMKISM